MIKGSTRVVVALIVVLLFLFGLFYGVSLFLGSPDRVCFKGGCVEVQIAKEKKELERGLQDRSFLSPHEGMLFIFPFKGRWDFWMKDTLISLDIIWLDENQNVTYIAEELPPCITSGCPSYGPSEPSRYVLEVSAGGAKRLGVHLGDQGEYKKGR